VREEQYERRPERNQKPSRPPQLLKTGLATAGAVTLSAGLLEGTRASAQSASLTAGDIAILQFLAAGELLEADFWTQYNELGGSRTTKFRVDLEIDTTPKNRERSIRTSLNISVTTPTTRSVTRALSMRILSTGAPSLSAWSSSERWRGAKRQGQAEIYG
jgi:hypothetical protein